MPSPATPLTRRAFLAAAGSLSATVLTGSAAPPAAGRPVADAFDAAIDRFMAERKIPGGALAVLRHGRLVYAQGYGRADRDRPDPVEPAALFRIASLSKPLTAAAILKLAAAGRLDLDAPVLDLLGSPPGSNNPAPDPRLRAVTVRHCLQHTGGWDRAASGDPMFRPVAIAREAGVPPPAMPEHIIRHMLGRPLDFDPGTRHAYSNFGYCLLGRIIENVSGRGYGEFMRDEILRPLGIQQMCLGRTLAGERAPGEVRYHTPGDRQGESVFPAVTGRVPVPYGTFCLEAMDAHGGWLASVLDLARFTAAMDAPPGRHWLPEVARTALYQPPAAPVARQPDGTLADHWYAAGWQVRPAGHHGGANYWHTGSLPGTHALLVRRHDGLSWIALFNQRSEDPQHPDGTLDAALHRAADAVTRWPDHDLLTK